MKLIENPPKPPVTRKNRINYQEMIKEIKHEINQNEQPIVSPNNEWWYWKGANDLGKSINYIINEYEKEQ